MTLQFKGRIRRSGNSYVITVPNDLVKHEMLQDGKEYTFRIEG